MQKILLYFYVMKKICCLIAFVILIASACKNKSGSSGEQNRDNATEEYYPVSSYIQSQVKKLDSLPLGIIKYTTVGNKTDTAVVDKKDFASIAAYFSSPDITVPGFKNQFDEASFIDASIGTIALTYTAKNDTITLRKADVLLKQEDSRVRTIYIEKKKPVTEGTLIQKMLWTTDRNVQITTIEQSKEAPEKVTIEKYVWDDRP